MAKLFVSLCAVLSVFAFVCVNGQEKFTIPQLVIPINTLNVVLSSSGTEYDVTNFSYELGKAPNLAFSTTFSKVGPHILFEADKNSYSQYIDNVKIPLGTHLYRDDVKKLFSYPPVGSGVNDAIHRCEDKGASTMEGAASKFMEYVDPAFAVRGQAIFTNKASTSWYGLVASTYSYTEEKPISGNDNYDKVQITHSYVIADQTQMCLYAQHIYRRHIKDGDYEVSAYATNSISISMDIIFNPTIFESDEDLLEYNYNYVDNNEYDHNAFESMIFPNVAHHSSGAAYVCPEIDFLPRIPLIRLLTSGNYSEYEFVLDNPVSVAYLAYDAARILNLTVTNEEYKVSFDGVNKIDDKWSVDLVIPSKYADALATAIENGDIKKSELPVISKVKKMNKKN